MSHDFIKNYREIFEGIEIPSFLLDIPKFAKCLYYAERKVEVETLEFETDNIERWKRSKQAVLDILSVLNPDFADEIKIKFKSSGIQGSELKFGENPEGIYANILLSGGADSLCGANHYVKKTMKKVIFTHTYHRNTPSLPTLKDVAENDFNMPFYQIDGQFTQKANIRKVTRKKETDMFLSTLRSFHYLSNAIPINYIKGIDKVLITENGPLTINPIFTHGFGFSNTTNPEFIEFFNKFIKLYFNTNLIVVSLPFKQYTKAELMCSTNSSLLMKSHSCSKFYNEKKSCLNCYACFLRKFSAYAYNNFEEDRYSPINQNIRRYVDDSIFKKKIAYFQQPKNRFLIDLIVFCKDTIKYRATKRYSRKYPSVLKSYRELDKYFKDFWDLLTRYSYDILVGLYNFYNKNKNLKNEEFYVWSTFNKTITDLLTEGVIQLGFETLIKKRIEDRAKSLRGILN